MVNFGRLECGVIYDPTQDELFTAVRGGGAALNGRPMRVTEKSGLTGSLLCTGFPLWYPTDNNTYFEMLRTVIAGGGSSLETGDILTTGPTLQTQLYEAFLPYAAQLPIRLP